MTLQTNTNSLINEIMSNDTSAVMLFAPAGTGKTDFLTELSNRYSKVFWFNALTDIVESFTFCLAEKIFKDAPENLLRIKQLIYCNSEFNNNSIIITAILQNVSKIRGNCLMVFERMEKMPKDFDYSLIERLIKHSPKNLKIVISSDNFINLDYTRFEPLCPKLIDETILMAKQAKPDFVTYLNELSKEQIAFLCYVADLHYVDKFFIESFYPQGVEIFELLSRKECFVATRDVYIFRLNSLLRNWLRNQMENYADAIKQFTDINVFERFGDFLMSKEQYFLAFKAYQNAKNIVKANKSILKLLSVKGEANKLFGYAKYIGKCLDDDCSDYIYYQFYLALHLMSSGNSDKAIENLIKIITTLKEEPSTQFYTICGITIYILDYYNHFQLAHDIVSMIRNSINVTSAPIIEEIICQIPKVFRALDLPLNLNTINQYETEIKQNNNSINELWYPKAMQALAEAYFDCGNYKKAMQLINEIKIILPFYVIPHNLILFYYYSGEIERANSIATEALAFALKHEITKDISLLYNALANIDLYYGRTKQALEKYDHAVSLDREISYTKFYNISQRCISYSRFGDINYAKEVAHIYLKYCETYAPQYVNMMLGALGYCYFKLKNYERAYYYANKCVKTSKTRSIYWIGGIAIAATHLLAKNELKDATTLIRNIIKSSYVYGMEIVMIDNLDVFEKLLDYASEHDIEPEYLERVYHALDVKKGLKTIDSKLKIKFFGGISITIKDKEVQWKTRKAKELFLIYILAGDNGIDRDAIIEILWKGYLYESAINNLKTSNNIIRNTLKSTDIEFKLDYFNSKYVLKTPFFESDLREFKALQVLLNEASDIYKQTAIMDKLMVLSSSDFAQEIDYPDFLEERKEIKNYININLLRIVHDLAKIEDYIEAKKYLLLLNKMDKFSNYAGLMQEIDSKLNINIEVK